MSTQTIKIGVLSTLIGPYVVMGEEGMRGADLAVEEFGGQVAGKRIQLMKEGTNAIPDYAVQMADSLLKQGADFLVAPLSGNEGLALRDYAKTKPERAFINGAAGAQEITLRDPAPNFFSFIGNGVTWTAGLADYAYHELGYRRMITIGEDYSFPHSQIGAFVLQFCRLGGKVTQRHWVPLGTSDFSALIDSFPSDIDAIYVALGGHDGVFFMQQYNRPMPLIGGALTTDQTVLNARVPFTDKIIGLITARSIADINPDPAWTTFADNYRKRFRRGLASPSLLVHAYYVNMKAALLALQQVEGDLSDGQAAFKAALAKLEFMTPTGKVRLDHNRNAIADNFITTVERSADGRLYNRLVKVIPQVEQTLGIPEDEYLQIGTFTRDNPPLCE